MSDKHDRDPVPDTPSAEFPALPLTSQVPLIRRTNREKTVAMLKETTRIGVPIIIIVTLCCTVIAALYGGIMVKFGEISVRLDSINKENSDRNERMIRIEMQREFDAKMGEQMNAKLQVLIDTRRTK